MKNNKNVFIIVFSSSSYSMKLYKILKEKRFKVDMISTPCTISAGCSRAIKIKKEDLEKIEDIIREEKIKIKAIYEKVINGRRMFYRKINRKK